MIMGKEVNLNSPEWIDMIFEGRNKKYGAYFLRNTSSKRHIIAIFVMLASVVIVSLIPTFIETVKSMRGPIENVTGDNVLVDLTQQEKIPEENIIKQEELPPPPEPLRETIKNVPPAIVSDDQVREEDRILSQEELQQSTAQVSIATVEGTDDPNALDIADVRNQQKIVQEKPKEVQEVIPIKVEQMPEFPGGDKALKRFLDRNLRYPQAAEENGIQGIVIVRFVVRPDGSITDINVVVPVDRMLDEEAVRVIKSMPKWVPGMQNGHAVSVLIQQDIKFVI